VKRCASSPAFGKPLRLIQAKTNNKNEKTKNNMFGNLEALEEYNNAGALLGIDGIDNEAKSCWVRFAK
jgi:hypothetical protein